MKTKTAVLNGKPYAGNLHVRFFAAVLTVGVAFVCAADNLIQNASFEEDDVQGWKYITPAQWESSMNTGGSAQAGVTDAPHGTWASGIAAPDGGQVAILQGSDRWISQPFVAPKSSMYYLSFMQHIRSGNTPGHRVAASIDGNLVVVGIAQDVWKEVGCWVYLEGGSHTLKLMGTATNGDQSSLLDMITVRMAEEADAVNYIQNGSFENEALAQGFAQRAPIGWSMPDGGYLTTVPNGTFADGLTVPDGYYAAVIHQSKTLEQTVHVPKDGRYLLSFWQHIRTGNAVGHLVIVSVDSTNAVTVVAGNDWTKCECLLSLSAGSHLLKMTGSHKSDQSSLIDDMRLMLQDEGLNIVANGSFEADYLTGFKYQSSEAPWITAWTSGDGGITPAPDPYFAVGLTAPDGRQVGLIQNARSLSQSFVSEAGSYRLSFVQRIRTGNAAGHRVTALVDGVPVAIGAATETWKEVSAVIKLAAGSHTLKLDGLSVSGDQTSLVDLVQVVRFNGRVEVPSLCSLTADPQLVYPTFSLSDISEAGFSGIAQGAGFGAVTEMTNGFNVAEASDAIHVEMQLNDGDSTKAVIVKLTDGTGGVFGQIVAARETACRLGQRMRNANGTYNGTAVAIARTGGDDGFGLARLTVTLGAAENFKTTDLLDNGSFEGVAVVGLNSSITENVPWSGDGSSVVAKNSYFSYGIAGADGGQMAYVQKAKSITQNFSVVSSGVYRLTYYMQQRTAASGDYSGHALKAQIDGRTLAEGVSVAGWTECTANVLLEEGSHTLTFLGATTSKDCGSLIDGASILWVSPPPRIPPGMTVILR